MFKINITHKTDKSILVKPMFLFEDKLEKALIACSGNLPLTIKKEDFHITSRESGSIWNKLFMFKAYTEVPKSLLIELLKKIGQKIYIEINIKK